MADEWECSTRLALSCPSLDTSNTSLIRGFAHAPMLYAPTEALARDSTGSEVLEGLRQAGRER
jgi:hypothetical protein